MTNATIKSFAEKIRLSVEYLVKKLADAGINKNEIDSITKQEREIFFSYLNAHQNINSNKLTLQRKVRTMLNVSSIGGKSKLIPIEVRKKHTYIQQNLSPSQNFKSESSLIQEDSKIEKSLVTKKYTLIDRNVDKNIKSVHFLKKSDHKNDNLKFSNLELKDDTKIIEKNDNNVKILFKKNTPLPKDNNNDYVSHSYYKNNTEDKKKQKTEYENRVRKNKVIKQKKNNRLYDHKNYLENSNNIRHRKNKKKSSTLTQSFNKPTETINRNIVIGKTTSISELANKMAIKCSQLLKKMISLGFMTTINQVLDQETAQLLAEEMGHKVILLHENELEQLIMNDRETKEIVKAIKSRAPVVTVMGHVDHGKTSLLDYIRSTKIAEHEVGGITQHIGAYHVKTKNGMITFIDTPGHAAFASMRARGVKITDIIILIVAADDGVMPQTIEAIQHAKEANVPIIVAVNKIDKKGSNVGSIKKELVKHGLISEDLGGENQFIEISSKFGTGIDNLLNAILLQSEMLELTATYNCMAKGIIIESFLDKGRGPTATVLVREGILNCNDVVLCGLEYGRIRAIRNELGKIVTSVGPSIPVEILGLSGVPIAGDEITVVRNEKKAREVAIYRKNKFREIRLANHQSNKIENLFSDTTLNKKVSLMKIILKSDTQGSSEAIAATLENLSNEAIIIKIISSGVGEITETDANLAIASHALLIGFNVRSDTTAKRIIESECLNVRYCSIIYNLLDEIKKIIDSMSVKEHFKKTIGFAEVRNIFRSKKFGLIAGCMITEGMVKRHDSIKIFRKGIIIHEGELESLRRFKEDINEVRCDMECGIKIKNYHDIQIGDIIEVLE